MPRLSRRTAATKTHTLPPPRALRTPATTASSSCGPGAADSEDTSYDRIKELREGHGGVVEDTSSLDSGDVSGIMHHQSAYVS